MSTKQDQYSVERLNEQIKKESICNKNKKAFTRQLNRILFSLFFKNKII